MNSKDIKAPNLNRLFYIAPSLKTASELLAEIGDSHG